MAQSIATHPQLSTPFFSLFDPRLRPKGSRDPLGIEAVWGFLGRELVGNLTTVTSNLDSFMVALLACEYANIKSGLELKEIQERFARMEQLLSYLRLSFKVHTDKWILGVTKITERINESEIILGLANPILNNQLSAGLWGLYTPALFRADLVEAHSRQPTKKGHKLTQQFCEMFSESWKQMIDICDHGLVTKYQREQLRDPVEGLFINEHIRIIAVEALIATNRDCEHQSILYQQALQFLKNYNPTRNSRTQSFLKEILSVDELKEDVENILKTEPILIISETIFSWLQAQHDTNKSEIITSLDVVMKDIKLEVPLITNIPHQKFLAAIATALVSEEAETCLNVLISHHEAIMKKRGGAPWIEIRNNKVHVKVVYDRGSLPEDGLNSIKDKFSNSYFISSFLDISANAVR